MIMWFFIKSLLVIVFASLVSMSVSNVHDVTDFYDNLKKVNVESSVFVSTTTGQVVKVIDGDTIDVIVKGSSNITRVRYIGIDTPEPYGKTSPECGSKEATARNRELVAGRQVTLVSDQDDTDKYGRKLRYVYVDNKFINEVLIREGWARTLTIPPNISYKYQFLESEEKAQNEKAGIWGLCF